MASKRMQYLALATDYDGTLARDGHVDEQRRKRVPGSGW